MRFFENELVADIINGVVVCSISEFAWKPEKMAGQIQGYGVIFGSTTIICR